MNLKDLTNVELESLLNMSEKYINYIGNQIKINQTNTDNVNRLSETYSKVNNKIRIILQEIINRINNIDE